MVGLLVVIFVIAYAVIALEEPLKVSKSAVALIGAGVLWAVYALSSADVAAVHEQLSHSLVGTAEIVFFLMGAMTVVEIVDAHDGFEVITSRLRTRTLATLAIFVSLVTFALSAVLDNLTTTIVMVSLLSRLLKDREDRLLMAGMIVIAANAGGAWSPIGDVTTTMLWIGGQVTTGAIVSKLILPSAVNLLVPLAIVAWRVKGKPIVAPEPDRRQADARTAAFTKYLMFTLGLAALLAVPVFKGITHLPPFVGILLGLGVIWAVGDVLQGRSSPAPARLTIANALTRIDLASIIFFIGILLAVATLEHAGVLTALSRWLDAAVGRIDVIVLLIGLLSAVIDNVPMVAAAMGMYDTATYPPDSFLWEFMAYCTGTGGSILIIGSAAGVAAMGIEKIDFAWYAKRFGLLATAGYLAGALVYVLQDRLLG
jgi:Na+/H+ antiporter NhaD/arsenite permease-like protein